MADTEQNNQDAGRTVAIHRVYVKDASFEAPNSPDIFSGAWEPKITLNIKTEQRALEKIGANHWEVSLHVSVEAKHDEKTALLAEVEQAGAFEIAGFEEEDFKRMLGSYCPSVLYPYAREAIGSMVSRGGFPQLVVQPLNFEAMYQQHLQQAAAKQA
ncbi:MAG: protein-export chaperone SecB [Gammaproteobacteria bacterium]|nr:protein-export chaperone SecB [Gammaproteobacteria bacterium]